MHQSTTKISSIDNIWAQQSRHLNLSSSDVTCCAQEDVAHLKDAYVSHRPDIVTILPCCTARFRQLQFVISPATIRNFADYKAHFRQQRSIILPALACTE
jgi:hypothetical protein